MSKLAWLETAVSTAVLLFQILTVFLVYPKPPKMVQLPRNIKSLLRMVCWVTLRVCLGARPLSSLRHKPASHQAFPTALPEVCVCEPAGADHFRHLCLGGEV